jgi:zinc protease
MNKNLLNRAIILLSRSARVVACTWLVAICALSVTACSSSKKSASGAAAKSGSGFQLPAYKTEKLANGLELLTIEDRRLPTYSVILLSRTGSRFDPKNQGGITLMTASLLEKGAGGMNATQIADAFGQLGADFDNDVDLDYTTFSVDGLAKDQAELTRLFATVLLKPTFNQVEINRLKTQAVAIIKRGYDEPDDFADRVFNSTLMANHPYGRSSYGSIKEINQITRAQIVSYYEKMFAPETSIIAVVGDYTPETIEQIKKEFGAWKQKAIPKLDLTKPVTAPNMQITLVERKDLQQAQLRFGHIGIDRSNPDFLALRVANNILGGSFSSRLMNRVRTQKGLTYGISSGFSPRLVEGPFAISTFTRFDKVGETVSETLSVVNEMRDKGVTENEVRTSIEFLKGAFPRAFETPEQMAGNLLTLRLYGIPDSYLTNYLQDINKLKKADIDRVVKKYFHPDRFQLIVYATPDVKSQLEPISKVEVKKYQEFMD